MGWASGSSEEKAATEISEAQKIQIWYSLGGRYSAPMEEIITKFNEREDLITIEGSYQGGYGTTQEKLVAAYIAGNPPVLSQLEQSLVGFFNKARIQAIVHKLVSGPSLLYVEHLGLVMRRPHMKDFMPLLLERLLSIIC